MKDTFKGIMGKLAKGEYAPVYFLAGEEPFYIDRISDYIEENVVAEADRDFNQAVFYAKDTAPEDVVASAKEFPFGVERRVVIAKEAKEWRSLEALKAYAKSPSPSTTLVICYKYAKLNAQLEKAFGEHGVVFDSARVADWKLPEWVAGEAKEHGFSISSATAALIAEHIGNDLSRIDNEFLKLKILLPAGAEITPDIVEKYIGISKQYNIFELRDALADRNEAKAYKIVNAFCQNTKANPVIGTVASLFNYYNAMLAYHLDATKSVDAQRRIFGYSKSEKMLARDARIAMAHSKDTLVKTIATLRTFDARAKGVDNVADDEQLYKELIYKILH